MMKKVLFVGLVLLIVAMMAMPAFADGPGASDYGKGYGELHKELATSGATGQGPERGGHVPGQAHGGMTGIAGVGNGG
ncbi:MAG: hypothetical protein PVH18_06910 [Chloroflexota bacterium]